jgi:hypothetical protein
MLDVSMTRDNDLYVFCSSAASQLFMHLVIAQPNNVLNAVAIHVGLAYCLAL